MSSFATVTAGNNTLASDMNQYANILNGSVAGGLVVTGGSNVYTPYIAQESSLPGSLQELFAGQLTADTLKRIALYLRSDGYSGLYGGTGAATTAHLYAQASGWRITESVQVDGSISAAGGSTFAGITNSGTFSSDAGQVTTNGAGLMKLRGNPVMVTNGSATVKTWTGTTDPGGSAAEGDLWANG